jgi:hypothetical protein
MRERDRNAVYSFSLAFHRDRFPGGVLHLHLRDVPEAAGGRIVPPSEHSAGRDVPDVLTGDPSAGTVSLFYSSQDSASGVRSNHNHEVRILFPERFVESGSFLLKEGGERDGSAQFTAIAHSLFKIDSLLPVIKEKFDRHSVIGAIFRILFIAVVFVRARGWPRKDTSLAQLKASPATRTASAMSFPSPSAAARAEALIPAASERDRPGLLPEEEGPRSTSKRMAVRSARAKASCSSFFPATGLGGVGGARFMPVDGD